MVANDFGQAETVWLNDGSGVFRAHPTTPSFGAGNSYTVALGYLDGDTDLDAVVANAVGQAETVWLNNGSGVFSAHPTTPSSGAGDSFGLTLGDLDGDSDLDTVVANANGQPETVWLNNGSGVFTAHAMTPSFGAGVSYTVALGDLDGDSDLDAVVANANVQPETVWLNNGSGVFTAHPTTPSFGAGESTDVALEDLDGDNDLDGLVANRAFCPLAHRRFRRRGRGCPPAGADSGPSRGRTEPLAEGCIVIKRESDAFSGPWSAEGTQPPSRDGDV